MIKPNMATMLAFVFSDIRVEVATLERQLKDVVSQSFNRITVDGDTSTNDACMLVASGKGIVFEELQAADQELYLAAARELFQELAMDLIRDAEGGTKFITVNVTGGRNGQECLAVAYALAESPLVKPPCLPRTLTGEESWLPLVGRRSSILMFQVSAFAWESSV